MARDAGADPNHRILDRRGFVRRVAPPLAILVLIGGCAAWTVHSINQRRRGEARRALARIEPDWRFEQLRDPRLTNVHLDATIVGDRWYVDAEPIDADRPFDEAMHAEVAAFIERQHFSYGVAWRGQIPAR